MLLDVSYSEVLLKISNYLILNLNSLDKENSRERNTDKSNNQDMVVDSDESVIPYKSKVVLHHEISNLIRRIFVYAIKCGDTSLSIPLFKHVNYHIKLSTSGIALKSGDIDIISLYCKEEIYFPSKDLEYVFSSDDKHLQKNLLKYNYIKTRVKARGSLSFRQRVEDRFMRVSNFTTFG